MLQHSNIDKFRTNQNNKIIKSSLVASLFKYSNIETFLHINAPTLKHWKL